LRSSIKKNIIFNKFKFFNLKNLNSFLKNIIIIIKVLELLTILSSKFILEDFEKEKIGNIIKIIPSSS